MNSPALLIVYASTEGQTEKIAGYMAGRLRASGATVDTCLAAGLPEGLTLDGYAAVIVGASVHLGRYPSEVVDFLRTHRQALAARTSGFFSVSASAASAVTRDDVKPIIADLVERTGWQPDFTANLAGAIRYLHYGPLKRLLMKRISAKAGGGIDTKREYEYTDWDEVDTFVDHVRAAAEDQPQA